jgi:hypothetical protein
MVDERMWTYPELKFVTVHQYKMDLNELVSEVNQRFHGGAQIRSASDVNKVMKGKTIFNKEKNRARGV